MMLFLLGCAARAPVEVGPPVETSGAFLLEAMGRKLAGTAVVSVGDDRWTLIGLAPTGTAFFTVSGGDGETEASSPDEGMTQVLGRIPFERDLWLLYRWRCADRCRADSGILQVEGDRVRWRGRGGPATVERIEGRTVLVDPRRRYTLTVLGP